MAISERERLQKYAAALKSRRSRFDKKWQRIDEFLSPFRTKFNSSETALEDNNQIVHSGVLHPVRICGAGMMAGITSPARKWFRLTTRDPDLAEAGAVRAWLSWVEERLFDALAKSNFYNCLSSLYPDLASFGTQCLFIEDDPLDVLYCELIPIGRFSLAGDGRRVTTVAREVRYTAEEMLALFGKDKVSRRVRDAYDRADYLAEFDVLHVVEPNRDFTPGRADTQGKRFMSRWLEVGGESTGFLRESGYYDWPAMTPRWMTAGTEVYAKTFPGSDALSSVRQTHEMKRRQVGLIDKSSNPPINVPASMRTSKISLAPGEPNYYEGPAGQGVTPALVVNPMAIEQVRHGIAEEMQIIRSCFYADLFTLFSDASGSGRQITATEIAAKQEEKLLQLGPVLEGLHKELLAPAINRAFSILVRRGMVPPPPKEIGALSDVRIEYISVLAQAQKMLGLGANERLVQTVTACAQLDPGCLDKVDFDELLDDTGERLGVRPNVLRSDEQVDELRSARAQQQQQAQQQQAALAATQGAKNLGQAQTTPDTALGALLGQLSPMAGGDPTGGAA